MVSFHLENCQPRLWQEFSIHMKQGNRHELCAAYPVGFKHPVYLRRNTSDLDNFYQIFIREEYAFLSGAVNQIMDLGAYIGLASAYFAHKFPDSRIIAIEPEKDNFTMLQLNTRPYRNVHTENVAVWSKNCDLELVNQVEGDWGNIFAETTSSTPTTRSVRAKSVMSLMGQHEIDSLSFLKVDVEGAEKHIFSAPDADSWISRCHLISCELHEAIAPGSTEAFHTALQGKGFLPGIYGEHTYYLRDYSRKG